MSSTNFAMVSLAVLTLFVDAWAIIAAVRRPTAAFEAAGKSKAVWLVLIIAGVFVCNVGFLVSLWYLFVIDPQVRRMERLGGGIGFPGGGGHLPS